MVSGVLLCLIAGVAAHPGHSHSSDTVLHSKLNGFLENYIFPCSARYNALLATLYISAAPCIIVTLIPAFRKAQKNLLLSLMMTFAFGTLIGDLILHLFPSIFTTDASVSPYLDLQHLSFLANRAEIDWPQLATKFEGESPLIAVKEALSLAIASIELPEGQKHLTDPMTTRTIIVGFLVFCGFLLFMGIDKCFRIAGFGKKNGPGADHGFGHSHSHIMPIQDTLEEADSAVSSYQRTDEQNLAHRHVGSASPKSEKNTVSAAVEKPAHSATSTSLQTSAYLTVASAFAHNITDGFALASSFYKSRSTGVVTTVAVLTHEIPHELGDFAILLGSGIPFAKALTLHAVGVFGALLGTLFGCLANEMAVAANPKTSAVERAAWDISVSDVMLPLTAGGLLFISTVGLVPELLKNSAATKKEEVKTSLLQLASILAGFALMAWMKLIE
ncbi:LAFA_0D13872g1_1 [Lachancea sp. 'fantastica']|nr:LAFA_0D13872g1_1 [Lachancea sp. 'fantastica']